MTKKQIVDNLIATSGVCEETVFKVYDLLIGNSREALLSSRNLLKRGSERLQARYSIYVLTGIPILK